MLRKVIDLSRMLGRHPRRIVWTCLLSLPLRLALLGAVLVAGSLTPSAGIAGRARAAPAPPVRYSYDAAGRLTGVADTKSNQGAIYHYDRAGNITSISRGSASIVPSPAQRAARGDGHVPVVKNVTSARTVITSAVSGAAVTVNGSNFDPNASRDVVRFDGTVAQVQSASPTHLSVLVPPISGPGPVAVTTPGGTGASAVDFFIPPGAYTASQVGVTATLSNGKPETVNLATSGKVALLAVSAPAAPLASSLRPQRMSVSFTSSTLGAYSVSVFDPQNRLVDGPRGSGLGNAGFAFDVASSGTYTIVVDPGTNAGRVQVTSTLFKDAFVPIAAVRSATAKPTQVSLTVPGQSGILSFKGFAGETVSAVVTSSTLDNGGLAIQTAAGEVLPNPAGLSPGDWTDRVTLPATRRYYITVNSHVWPGTGSLGLVLYRLTDAHASAGESDRFPGRSVGLSTNLPGENGSVSFKGKAGQDVSVALSNSANTGDYQATLVAPDHTVLETNGCGANCILDRVTLPQTGTYKILLIHSTSTNTLKVTATVYRNTDINRTVKTSGSLPGTPAVVKTTIPGQDAYLRFHGVRGHFISVAFANSTINGFYGVVKAPDGDQLTSAGFGFGTGSGYIDRIDAQQTGTYTLLLQHRSYNTGSVQVTVFEGVDVHKSIAPGNTLAGRPLAVALSIPGQNAALTFKGCRASTSARR